MALPKKIRIGGVDYAVSEVEGLRDGDQSLNGWIVFNKHEIQIEKTLSPAKKWIVAWHEVVHGLLEQSGQVDHDEKTVIALGYGITQVLRDNPWLREVGQDESSP